MDNRDEKLHISGYMTVSIAMILVLTISLCLTLIEGCRRSTIMLVAECALDTGMNSILAEYHRELLRQYGLFFIDTSYGTDIPDYGNTLEHLRDYVIANLGVQENVLEILGEDFIDLHWDEGEVIGVSVSSDEKGAVLRRQISECMEEELGISYVSELMDWIDVVEKYELTGGWYDEMAESARSELQEWMSVSEEIDGDNAGDWDYFNSLLNDVQGGMLELLLGLGELSNAEIYGEIYLSNREVLRGTGMNPSLEFKDDIGDWLFLYEYILRKTGHYGSKKENCRLQYQTEYILCGLDSDIANISELADRLFAVRAAADLVHVLGNQEKMDMLKKISDKIAMVIGKPESSSIIQILLATIWAAFEATWDVSELLDGKKVPLIKNNAQWHYDIGAVSPEEQGSKSQSESGLYYEDYLRIFLALQDVQITTYRLMDVMEMDIRLTPGNENFRMDGCVDSVTVCVDLESGYGYQFFVTRNYGY